LLDTFELGIGLDPSIDVAGKAADTGDPHLDRLLGGSCRPLDL